MQPLGKEGHTHVFRLTPKSQCCSLSFGGARTGMRGVAAHLGVAPGIVPGLTEKRPIGAVDRVQGPRDPLPSLEQFSEVWDKLLQGPHTPSAEIAANQPAAPSAPQVLAAEPGPDGHLRRSCGCVSLVGQCGSGSDGRGGRYRGPWCGSGDWCAQCAPGGGRYDIRLSTG